MEKKPNNDALFTKIFFIVVFFALLVLPISLMALIGPDNTALESEAATKIEEFSADSWFDGSFQSSFEAWFSNHYPMRSGIVKAYRQFKYDFESSKPVINTIKFLNGKLFKKNDPVKPPKPVDTVPVIPVTDEHGETVIPETKRSQIEIYLDPDNIYSDINFDQMEEEVYDVDGFKGNNAVYVGKNGYLFEAAYMDEYMGYTEPYISASKDIAGMQKNIEELEYIQEELAKRGIVMLYVISSSKADQYADYIPDWYKDSHTAEEDYVRAIYTYRDMLKNSKINYLDSSEYYKEIGLLVTFPKNGIHWNALAAFESTAELLRMYENITGERITRLTATGVQYSKNPFNQGNGEQDVFNILYGAVQSNIKILDNWYYAPQVKVDNEGAKKLNILIQGGSFTGSIIYNINAYQVGHIDQIYYNGTMNGGAFTGSHSPWTEGPEAWEYWLKDRDLLIFEATEQQIRGGHASGNDWAADAGNGFIGHNVNYDSLYQYLKNHEGEY